MNRQDDLRAIAKDCGPIKLAKYINDEQDSHGITEGELTDMVGKHDPKPGESAAQTFTRHYTAQTADGVALRKAMQVAKMATLAPSMSGGLDEQRAAINATESSEAYKQLMTLANEQHSKRNITEAQAFAAALADPANRELAQKALARPAAPAGGMYEFPR
jgi:hypothetical protein